LAYQGAVLQSIAVAVATASSDFNPDAFLRPMRASLSYFSDLLQDVSNYERALTLVANGLAAGTPCRDMSLSLGTGIVAHEAVAMGIYCFLRHPDSFAQVIHEAVFIGGDTDTIACMAGAIAGAFPGIEAIPKPWLNAVREEEYSVGAIEAVADRLLAKYTMV
jgi:poly(ADP-ribose) glycohydrolase ARH3